MKKKNNVKKKLISILNSYKTIIYISFLLNIILLLMCYKLNTSNIIYTFSGNNEYLKVKDGIIVLNNDINMLNGNNVEYIGNDEEIVSYKIGYYLMDDKKYIEIISNSRELDNEVKLSEIVKNFTSLNITEKKYGATYFTSYKKGIITNGLYLILDAKTKSGDNINTNLKLNITKVSKY